MEGKCVKCKFYEDEKDSTPEAKDGLCKRYPPTVFPAPMRTALGGVEIGFQSTWVPVPKTSCCGEYAEKVTAEDIYAKFCMQ